MPIRRLKLATISILLAAAGLSLLVGQFPVPDPIFPLPAPPTPPTRPRVAADTQPDLRRTQPVHAPIEQPHRPPSFDPRLARFTLWAERFATSPPADRLALEAEGLALARARRPVLLQMIRANPKAALAAAIPAPLRAQLPPPVQAELESHFSGLGDLVVLARTDPTAGPLISRRVILNGSTYEAYAFGALASQRSAQTIPLHGIALDGSLALDDFPPRAFEADGSLPAHDHALAASPSAAAFGPRSALVMMVDFPGLPGGPVPAADAEATLAKVSDFLHENSFGMFRLATRSITPVLRLPFAGSHYRDEPGGDFKLLADARAAATSAGFNPSDWDFEIVAFAHIGFPWSGTGVVGGRGAWIQGAFPARTVAHELGHNLGLWHANFWQGQSSPTDPVGAHHEYGHEFDVMGRTAGFPSNHFNANFKSILGWLPPENILTVTNSGVFRLHAQDLGARLPGLSYGLRIPGGFMRGGELQDYWVEFRQLLSSWFPATQSGAIIAWGNDIGGAAAFRLLDSTFSTSSKSDSPLQPGASIDDPENGIRITTLSAQGQGTNASLDLQVALSIPKTRALAIALDTPSWSWSSPQDCWIGQSSFSHDGVDAAATAPLPDAAEARLETALTGPGTLSFWWKVSSEAPFDRLKLLIDGREVDSISGESGWRQRVFDLEGGNHTIHWVYQKDSSAAAGADRAWLDEVAFRTGYRPPVINTPPASTIALLGETAQFSVEPGGSLPRWFQWSFSDGARFSDIPHATNATLIIPDVQPGHAGQYFVRVFNPVGSAESAPASLYIASAGPPSAPPILNSVNVDAASITLEFAAPSHGSSAIVESSTDLARWTPIATNPTPSRLKIKRPASQPAEFFRARAL